MFKRMLALLALVAFAACAQIIPTFTISTVAGDGTAGFSGDGGPATAATFRGPFGVVLDAAGNIYVADFNNERVRKIATDGTISTIAGTGVQGFGGDGGPAVNAMLSRPSRISIDSHGNLFLTDPGNSRVRKISPNGIITTVAGNGNAAESGDGGLATNAALNYPESAVADAAGNLYISDGDGNVVRKVDTNGIISTVVGTGNAGHGGDGGAASKATLNNPSGLALDGNGNLFIADSNNNRIRKVTNGIITTIAGNGTAGFSGDGGQATSAALDSPSGPILDSAGNLYFADASNNRVRVILTNGTIETVAGSGPAAYGGDGGPAVDAELHLPLEVATSPSGSLYIADGFNQRVRLLTPGSGTPSISSGGVLSAGAFGGFTSVSPGSWIEIYGSSLAKDTRGWGSADFTGNNAPTNLDGTSVSVGGKSAFIDYISPGQVNALLSSDTPTGSQQLTLTTGIGTSAAYDITVNALEPGLLAPASFVIGGIAYAAAVFQDGNFALPEGAVGASRPAKPGDLITLYGIGFGPVTPAVGDGEITQQLNSLASSFQMSLGGSPLSPSYDGLAPQAVGLYQFNITVPNLPAGNTLLTFTLAGAPGTQTLYIPVSN
jgi:uncharacterized protein (TIGR03437 family)